MAYSFNGSNQFLSLNPLPVTIVSSNLTSPSNFTISAWVYISGGQNTRRGIVSVYANNVNARCSLLIDQNNLATAHVQGVFSAVRIHSSINSINLNTWHNVVARFLNNQLPTVYLDGVQGNTVINNGLSLGTTGGVSCSIGIERPSTSFFNGLIADVGIWDTDSLTIDEITSLSKGMVASNIRPQSLIFYAPLIRDLSDFKNKTTITNNNSATVGNHPRTYY